MTQIKIDTIRASEADRILQCGAAAEPPVVPIDISGPEALIGRAAHEAIELWINAERKGEPAPQPAANKHGVAPSDIADLIQNAPSMLREIREDLSNLRAEINIKGGLVRGRVDAIALAMSKAKLFSLSILDWKTGRDPSSNSKPGQRLAYASAAEAAYGMPAQGYIYTAELWLATGEIIASRFDSDSIAGFRARIAEQLERGTAAPGPHCQYCPRSHECAAREVYIRSAANSLADIQDLAFLAVPEVLAELWDQSRDLKRALDTYEKAVDLAIDKHGEIDLGDGRKLVHGTKSIDTIEPAKAWQVLRSFGLDRQEIEGAIKLSKTALLDAIAKRAPRGKKQQSKTDLVTALDLAGAIDRKVLKYRRVSVK